MKATGIVRRIDDLGRIVIPKELRRVYDIKEGDPLEVFTSEHGIVFRKYVPGCVICGGGENLQSINGKPVCLPCVRAAARQL